MEGILEGRSRFTYTLRSSGERATLDDAFMVLYMALRIYPVKPQVAMRTWLNLLGLSATLTGGDGPQLIPPRDVMKETCRTGDTVDAGPPFALVPENRVFFLVRAIFTDALAELAKPG